MTAQTRASPDSWRSLRRAALSKLSYTTSRDSSWPTHPAPASWRICGIAGTPRLLGFDHIEAASSSWERPWPEPIDPAQDLGEQGARHRDLGQLEHDVAAMAHDLGADLDQLLP